MLFLRKKWFGYAHQKGLTPRGFTLLELLIVVIIIGILGTLALPRFFRAVERVRWAEAKSILGTIRTSQIAYRAQYGGYSSDLNSLDVDLTSGGTTGKYFSFVAVGWNGEWIAYGVRNAVQDSYTLNGQSIWINSDGSFWYSSGYQWLR